MPTGNSRHVAIVNNFGSGKKIRNVLRKSIAIREILEGTFIMLELLEKLIQRIMLSIGSLEEATLQGSETKIVDRVVTKILDT